MEGLDDSASLGTRWLGCYENSARYYRDQLAFCNTARYPSGSS